MSDLTANTTTRKQLSSFSRATLTTSYAVVAVAGALIASRGEPLGLLVCVCSLFAVFCFGFGKPVELGVRSATGEVVLVFGQVVFALCMLWFAL